MAGIIAKDSGGGNFLPAPEGVSLAVCVDVVDRGMVASTYNGETRNRHMIRIMWQLDGNNAGIMDDGKPWIVTRGFTLSLHEKSALRPFLEAWRGAKFKETDLKNGFDVEKLIGVTCMVQVLHEMSDDGTRTYANVASIMPAIPKGAKLPIMDYVRVKDRTPSTSTPTGATIPVDEAAGEDPFEGMPF